MPEVTEEMPIAPEAELLAAQPPKTKKVKTTVTVNGQEKEVEIEVPDVQATWGTKADRRAIGARRPRLDGPDKVTGRAKYTYDVKLPDLLRGKILRSPHAKARITKLDLAPAKAIPGVQAVIALKQVGNQVQYHGDAVAALAATSIEIAEDALRAIVVEYEVLPFSIDPEQSRQKDSPVVTNPNRPNVQSGNTQSRGDLPAAYGKAAKTVTAGYQVQGRVHVCLETHGHVVAPQPDGKLRVWSSTQAVHGTHEEFTGISSLPKDQVILTCDHMGGGFGSKFGAGVEGRTAYELAKLTGKPVKLMLDRREEAISAGSAPNGAMTVKIAGAQDGTLLAVEGDGWSSGGVGGGGFPFPYLYNFPAVKVKRDTVLTNRQPSNSMRAPGHPQGSFLMESAVDELAYALGMDPLELRRKNDKFPIRQEEYKMGAERIQWDRFYNKAPGANPVGGKVQGVGVAAATWGGGGGQPAFKAEVAIAQDGTLTVRVGTQDLGTGVRTFITSIVADEFHQSEASVKSEIGSSRLPYSAGSGGSTTTPSVAPAVKMAAIQAKFDFLNALAKATQEPVANLTLTPDGGISNGKKTLTWKDACKRLPSGGIVSVGAWESSLVQTGIGGVQFAHVEVDMDTGRVRPVKFVAIHDAGIVMNPLTMESQINGGIIQGLGFALYEDEVYDRQTGRMLNPNMEEYKIPGPWEMPVIESVVYEPPDAKGVSGMAESPVIPTASAIANAVYNACGARVRSLPITPAKVLQALGKVPAPKPPPPGAAGTAGGVAS